MINLIRFIVFPVVFVGAAFQTLLWGPFMAGMDLAYAWLYHMANEEDEE